MPEQSRAHTSSQVQRDLPFAPGEQRDEAYEELVEVAVGWPCGRAVVRWLLGGVHGVRGGERVRVRPSLTVRKIAVAVGFGSGTVSEALGRLRGSRLVEQADGEYRLRLSWLVEIAESQSAAGSESGQVTAAEAAVLLGRARACSGVLGRARTVREIHTKRVPETVAVPETVTGVSCGPEQPEQAERGGQRNERGRAMLRASPAWRRLQSRHFRCPASGADAGHHWVVRIDVPTLRPAYMAAVEAELIGTDHEDKVRFLATAYDVAAADGVRSPVPVLLGRVADGACYRISEEGRQWARRILTPAEYREADRERQTANCG